MVITYAGNTFYRRCCRDAVDGRRLLVAGSRHASVKIHGRESLQAHGIRNLEIEILLRPLSRAFSRSRCRPARMAPGPLRQCELLNAPSHRGAASVRSLPPAITGG